MTGFLCILDRANSSVDHRLLEHLAEPLGMHGGVSSDVCRGPVGIAVAGNGAGEGDTSEPGPLVDTGNGPIAALYGRMSTVDHPRGGRETAGRPPGPVTAAHAQRRFREEGTRFLAGTAGSFALIVADPGKAEVTLIRDHLGSVKAYYYLDDRWFIASSEPAAILRHPAVSRELDEGTVARFLGFRSCHTNSSFYRQVKELAPAHWLRVTEQEHETGQYWRFDVGHQADEADPRKVCADFRSMLGQAVRHDLAGLEPEQAAISLSGGLDSTAVAALSPRRTPLYSWFFDDATECDEQLNVRSVEDYLQRPVHRTKGDGLHALCGDYVEQFVHTGSPYLNPFASLKQRLYQTAKEAGCKRVLVGDGGDVLYAAQDYWLRDLLLRGRPGALKSLASTVAAARRSEGARLALRRLLPVRHVRSAFRCNSSPWLTNAARGALPPDRLSPILPPGWSRYRFDPGIGAKHIELESEERRLFNQCRVERGNPFWYWPLLEKVLNLPAWWLYRDGRTKVLTREAMRGLLPKRVLDSPTVGLLGSFFLRGLELNREVIRDLVFRNPRSDWRRYVNEPWVAPYLTATKEVSFGHTILWRVISYELWYRRVAL